VGIEDHELSDFFGLTTVAQLPERQGRLAVELLMDELNPNRHSLGSSNTRLPFELIVRSSTARPAAH